MHRRDILTTGLALPVALASPSIVRAENTRTLKFVPQSDLTVLDPIWTTAFTTRNHAFLVFDTLYGQDDSYAPQLQMLAGHSQDAEARIWKLTLRDGLVFHDGTPVLARDCVASLRRWGNRDSFGQALFAAIDELSAPNDKTMLFRLKRPFPLPLALSKPGANVPVIMPERLAETDPFKQVTEMVGSGPFRFRPDERLAGSRVVYERFDRYRPRGDGVVSFTAGPKVARFDRVEWVVIPDPATAHAALQSGEVDWWELPLHDLLPAVRQNSQLRVSTLDPTGMMGMMRPNFLFPPFDNPAFRLALAGAVTQSDFMTAVAGSDRQMWRDGVGAFCPMSPFASPVASAASPGNIEVARQAVKASGYNGEKVVLLGVNDIPSVKMLCDVGADLLTRCGLNVDHAAMDAGSMVQRRAKMDAPDQGGWSVFFTYWGGLDMFNPAATAALRGNGRSGWFGWPTMPRLEELRQSWLDAADLAEQKAVAVQIQQLCDAEVPFYPLGQLFQPTAHRAGLSGLLKGFPLFWNVSA